MLPLSAELSTFGEHSGKHRGLALSHVTRRFRCLPTEPWDREEPDVYTYLCHDQRSEAIGLPGGPGSQDAPKDAL